jgi:hypothetical protein
VAGLVTAACDCVIRASSLIPLSGGRFARAQYHELGRPN